MSEKEKKIEEKGREGERWRGRNRRENNEKVRLQTGRWKDKEKQIKIEGKSKSISWPLDPALLPKSSLDLKLHFQISQTSQTP